MKKYLLLSFLSFLAGNLLAQTYNQDSKSEQVPFERSAHQRIGSDRAGQVSEWFNYGEEIDALGGNVNYYRNYLFPDSTVVQIINAAPSSVWKNSLGQTFDPTSSFFVNNTIIDSNISFTLDSIGIYYRYFRFQNAAPDTLVVQIFDHSKLAINPDPWGDGRCYARPPYDYISRKGLNPTSEYTYILTDADTISATQGLLKFPVNTLVNGGKKIAASFTFFPGNPFNVGDTIDVFVTPPQVNRLNAFLVYTYRDDDKIIDPLHYNHELNASKEVRYNINTNGWNGKYIPGQAWNAGFYHLDMEFKITTLNLSVGEPASNVKYMQMLPNPSNKSEEMILQYSLFGNDKITLSVFDVSGKLVTTFRHDSRTGINKINFDAGIFNPGIYFVKLQGEKSNHVMKFIVQ